MLDIDIKGKLFPSLEGMIISALVVLVLYIIVRRFFWNALTEFLDQRATYIQSHITEAKKLEIEAKQEYSIAQQEKTLAAKEHKEIVDNAREYANKLTKKITDEAKVEAEAIVASAKLEAEAYKSQIKHEVYTDLAKQAVKTMNESEEEGQENHSLRSKLLKKLEEI